jgi:hypothetical protein
MTLIPNLIMELNHSVGDRELNQADYGEKRQIFLHSKYIYRE